MHDLDIKCVFGERVRELRKQSQLSQEDFARAVGLDRSYIGGVERGERNISLENIWAICKGLDVSLDKLFRFSVGQFKSRRRTTSKSGKDS